jgi:hypothetical protein
LLRHEYLIEAIGAGVAALGAAAAAIKASADLERANDAVKASVRPPFAPPEPATWPVGLMWSIAALALLLGTLRAWASYQKTEKKNTDESPRDLFGCCLLLWALMAPRCAVTGDPESLRVTFYRVVKRRNGKPEELEQVVPYATGPNGLIGSGGKVMSTKTGIVGLVSRTGKPLTAARESEDIADFRKELVERWGFTAEGFTAEEAKGVDPTRWAWAAWPLKNVSNDVIGVVFLDSRVRHGFDEDATVQDLMRGCESLAKFVEWRYP